MGAGEMGAGGTVFLGFRGARLVGGEGFASEGIGGIDGEDVLEDGDGFFLGFADNGGPDVGFFVARLVSEDVAQDVAGGHFAAGSNELQGVV